jgi:hypothetical protein
MEHRTQEKNNDQGPFVHVLSIVERDVSGPSPVDNSLLATFDALFAHCQGFTAIRSHKLSLTLNFGPLDYATRTECA